MPPIYKQSGYKAAVNRIIELYKDRRGHSYIDPGFIAQEYAFLGDKDHALEWQAYQEKTDEMATLRIRRCYDFTRSDPCYKDLERRVGYTW
jgi:hypothetical protein